MRSRNTLLLGALMLVTVRSGAALAAPPPPDVTITVVTDPDQLDEHVNTLSLPPAASVGQRGRATSTKPAVPEKVAPRSKPVGPAARKVTAVAPDAKASAGAQESHNSRPAQSHAGDADQSANGSHSDSSTLKRQGARPDADPASRPDVDNDEPAGAAQAEPDADDRQPHGPPEQGGGAGT